MLAIRRFFRPLMVVALLASGMLVAYASVGGTRHAATRAVSMAAQTSDGSGTWTNSAPMPNYRSEMSAVALDGKIYVAGGFAGSSQNFEDVTTAFHYYDTATNTWHEAPPVPHKLHHLAMSALGGRIYITGGYKDSDFDPDQTAVWVFHPHAKASAAWKRAADMPAPRGAHTSVALNGLLYVIGGVTSNSTALWAYNPASNTWNTKLAPMPTRREHLTATAANGKLYVIAGRWLPSPGNTGTLEEYDPATDTWTAKANMPTPRSGLTSAVIDGKIHVTGGEDLSSSKTYNQHEVYDPATNTWATYPAMPTARHGLASAAVNGKWYVIGGGLLAGNQTYVSLANIVEVFTPSSGR
jgi:N-acetylneuraminic acid mutarotase